MAAESDIGPSVHTLCHTPRNITAKERTDIDNQS